MEIILTIGVTILGMIILLTCTIYPFLYVYRLGSKIRRKGYSPLASLGICALSLILTFFVSYQILKTLINRSFAVILVSYALCFIVLSIVWALLPRRSIYFGKRKSWVNYKYLGIFIQIVSGVTAIIILINYKKFENNYTSMGIFLLITYVLFANSLRIKYFNKTFEEQIDETTLRETHKDLVLYLRSFILDNNYFCGVRMRKHSEEFGNIFEAKYHKFVLDPFIYLTFQKFFRYQIEKELGLFFSLNNPNDLLPIEGTKAIYVNDEEWEEKFKYYLKEAKCIIIQPSISAYIPFELSEIQKGDFTQKSFIFVGPRYPNKIVEITQRVNNWAKDTEVVPWSEFEKIIIESGFKSSLEPEGGAVITFDSDNNLFILKDNCELPSDYINTVKESLEKL